MAPCYEILDHPADLGIAARGATTAEAFGFAAEGLMSIILDISTIEPLDTRTITVTATDREQLLVRWLGEVLYLYDGERFAGKRFIVDEFTGTKLCATIHGEVFTPAKHVTKLDVKAITYHDLQIEVKADGTRVRVFLDI